MQFLNLTASKPLYKCWKRAVNESAVLLKTQDKLKVYKYVEENYGCKTLHVQGRTEDNTVRNVDIEFFSERHLTVFMLRWS